jgi:hypothetical protein
MIWGRRGTSPGEDDDGSFKHRSGSNIRVIATGEDHDIHATSQCSRPRYSTVSNFHPSERQSTQRRPGLRAKVRAALIQQSLSSAQRSSS